MKILYKGTKRPKYNFFVDQALITCPKCQTSNYNTDFFCRSCGVKLKEKPLSTSILKQFSVYLISFFLPPFGLVPGIKYLRQGDSKSKQIGIIAIVLTIVSLAVTIWLSLRIMGSVNQAVNSQLGNF